MSKICFFCEHCTSEAGFAYSDVTWQSGKIGCDKGHWEEYGDSYDLVNLGTRLLTAEKCPDYKAAKGVSLDVQP